MLQHQQFLKKEEDLERKKICRGNPAETFETEKHWEYEVPWKEKEVKVEQKIKVKKKAIPGVLFVAHEDNKNKK